MITPVMRRWARRHILINAAGNLVIRVEDGAPIELFSDRTCPRCSKSTGDCECGFLSDMTLREMVERGFARRVEQL